MNDRKQVHFLNSYLGHHGGTQGSMFYCPSLTGHHGLEDRDFLNIGAQRLGPQQAGAQLRWPSTCMAGCRKTGKAHSRGYEVTLRQPPAPRLWSSLCISLQMFQSRSTLQREAEGPQRWCLAQWAGLPITRKKMSSESANHRVSSLFVLSCLAGIHFTGISVKVPSLATLLLFPFPTFSWAFLPSQFSWRVLTPQRGPGGCFEYDLQNFSPQKTVRRGTECIPATVMPLVAKVPWVSE